MKTVIALLAVLAVAAVSVSSVKGQRNDETWVSNQSSKSIRASTVYDFLGHSDFQNRLIAPSTAQMDIYTWGYCNTSGEQDPVGVTLWLDGSRTQKQIWIACDASIVGEDNPDGKSVDIYGSVYGQINTRTGSVLVTISP